MIAGVDGCKAGWVAVIEEGLDLRVEVFRSFAELTARGFSALVVDIPIGLMANAPRAADRAARAFLGSRACCVFSAPYRPMLTAASYRQACSIRQGIDGKSCSQQAYRILDKVAQADAAMTPAMQARIREGHPEVSFALMGDGRAVQQRKKSKDGSNARLELLAAHFPDAFEVVSGSRPKGVGRDDLADAYAMLWTARRVVAGTSIAISRTVQLDDHGLHAEIYV